MNDELVKAFKAARRASTPLVGVSTADPAQVVDTLRATIKPDDAVFIWDAVTGLRGMNEVAVQAFGLWGADPKKTVSPVETLTLARDRMGFGAVLFLSNFHRFLDNVQVMQALWNLRDDFKSNARTAVLLGPSIRLPAELTQDVVLLDEPLPTRQELEAIVDRQHANVKPTPLPVPTGLARAQVLDAVVGLSAYAAESVIAMSLTKSGLDLDRCWDRKIKAIESTEGLRVWRGRERLDDLKGLDQVALFAHKLINSNAFGAIAFMDEMEKGLAGALSDHVGDTGVAKDAMGALLSYIEDTKSMGVLFAGVAGTAKTQLSKAIAHESGKPLIKLDLGGMKASKLGSSERSIRDALKVLTAVADGRVLFLGTANDTRSFTPELNRRFPDQFFFDLPDKSGRDAIWPVYVKANGLTPEQADRSRLDDTDWTGAEIKRVCERAALFSSTVYESAQFLVPQAVSARERIKEQREHAAGRFLSASHYGAYRLPDPKLAAKRERSVRVD